LISVSAAGIDYIELSLMTCCRSGRGHIASLINFIAASSHLARYALAASPLTAKGCPLALRKMLFIAGGHNATAAATDDDD
jgi:hypothetical protein